MEVTFDLVSASAKNKKNHSQSNMMGRPSEKEINKVVEDNENRKTIQVKNDLENVAYHMHNTLDDTKLKDMIKDVDEDKKKVKDTVRQAVCCIFVEVARCSTPNIRRHTVKNFNLLLRKKLLLFVHFVQIRSVCAEPLSVHFDQVGRTHTQ